jgi:hypothetical protein
MFTYAQKHHLHLPELLRWSARAFAVSLVIAWLVLVILESMRSGPFNSAQLLYQAAALAVVFVGYAVGWRSELAGGMIAILGTVAFFAAGAFSVGVLPPAGAVWFAAPGILYLLAWLFDDRHGVVRSPARTRRSRSESLSRDDSDSISAGRIV